MYIFDELGLTTTLGIGSYGYGMPTPTIIYLTYLVASVPSGLDSALVNPATQGLVATVRAIDFLVNTDAGGRCYIRYYRFYKGLTYFSLCCNW